MLHIFLQSLAIGALLATTLAAARALLRRAARRQQQEPVPGPALRCVRPFELSDR